MADDRRAFLGMPGYGELTAGAARGFWRASRLPDDQVYHQYNEGSLLAANFNSLWVSALNLVHGGRRVDYFAMQHADVEPCDWWLDSLIDEMEARQLDILGVVVPIKDAKGLTSIALDRPDGDPWRPLCRLTMTEVYRLPETFTSEDVGHPILLNTGLWVCRFDESWARQVRFTINDRIVYDRTSGKYLAQCEPEDWYFSRLLHEMGLKVGATRKIPLMHRGGMSFPNAQSWGNAFDAAWTDQSVLPSDGTGSYVMPEINGWLRHAEGAELARLARGKRVVEVGSYFGLSTVSMARTAAHVVSIDTHDGRGTASPQNTGAAFAANLARYGVADRVSVLIGTVETEVLDSFAPFNLAFIDGGHDRESVEADIRGVLPHMAPDGLIAFHDYASGVDPDVTAVVDELVASGGEILSVTDSLAVVKPPALFPLEV